MLYVKEFRKKLNLKQEDFANIIGVSKVNYSKKENGKIKFSLDEAHKISEHFNKSIELIFYANDVSKIETLHGGENKSMDENDEKK